MAKNPPAEGMEKRGVVAKGWTPPVDQPSAGCKKAAQSAGELEKLDDDLTKRTAKVIQDGLR